MLELATEEIFRIYVKEKVECNKEEFTKFY